MNEFQVLLSSVLCGNFIDYKKICDGICIIDSNGDKIEYKYQSKYMLRVFVSSTFTDTHLERNNLLDEILPILKEKVSGEGIEIVFVDMRYGVRDENTLEHETWMVCKKELMNCRDQSSGIFFLSLQSDKYGYQPIPKYIPQHEYEKRYQVLSEKEKNLIDEWYKLDSNSIPFGRYVLKALTDINGPVFANILPQIRDILKDISFDLDFNDVIIGRSVTEYEILSALSKVSDRHRVFWIRRIFDDFIPNDRNFNDTFNDDKDKEKLKNLLSKMESCISVTNISNVQVPFSSYIAVDNECKQYLKNWKEIILNKFTLELESILKRKMEWETDSFGIGVSGKHVDEMLHHCKLASEKSEDFSGRDDLINEALDIITSGICNNKFKICLSCIGISGAGKTALLSKLASLMRQKDTAPVIIRFCGTSGGSAHGLNLINSICKQIELIYDLSKSKDIAQYGEAVEYFHTLLSKYPVILFIDSLDQLSNNNMARSKISFLDGIKMLNGNSRIIVSSLPDELDYMYFCDTSLATENVTRLLVKSFDETDDNANDSQTIIYSLLNSKARTLSIDQMNHVMLKVAHEPTALYLRLAVKVVEKWYSYSQSNCVLTESVRGLINQLFSSLEHDYGEVLVSSVLGLITYSVGGLNTSHIQDLLSIDDDVISSTFQYSKPNILQIPTHVILRLYQSLGGLVVEREQGKVYWYHRQLKETAEIRYQSKEIRCRNLMAAYFSNILNENIREKRLIQHQPIFYGSKPWFKSANINVTLCIESVPQMLKSGNCKMIFEAYKRLCDLDYICASIKAGEGFHLISQLIELETVMRQNTSNVELNNNFRIAEVNYSEAITQIEHFLRWLRKDMNAIVRDPSVMLTVTVTAQSLLSLATKNMLLYMKNSTKSHGISFQEVNNDTSCWFRSRLFGGSEVFDSCLMVFPGHTVSVEDILRFRAVSFSKCCSCIVSGSDDTGVRIWDVKTGMETQVFEGHRDWVKDVSFSPCMRKILSCSLDNSIKIWDLVTGVEICSIEQSTCINSAKFSIDGLFVIWGSIDGSIRVWDTRAGAEVHKLEGHIDSVNSIDISNDGLMIVSGSSDRSIRVWNIIRGVEIHKFEGHSDAVNSVAFSNDCFLVVSGSSDSSVRLWDIRTGVEVHKLEGHKDEVFSVCFSPCGTKILSAGWDQLLRIWDVQFGFELQKLGGHSHLISSVSYSSCGRFVISGSFDNTIRLWDVQSIDVRKSLEEGHTNQVFSVCFSPCGSQVLSAAWDKVIILWDVESGHEVQRFEDGHSGHINCVCFSRDGSQFVSGSSDKSIILWDLSSSSKVVQMNIHQHYVNSVSFSPCGTKVVSGSHDKTIIIFDVASHTESMKFEGHLSWVLCVKFSKDGDNIISCSDDRSVRVWSVASGLLKYTMEGHSRVVISLALSPDGKTIASSSEDTTICLWNYEDGSKITVLNGHDDHVRSVSFSPDGTKLVSCSGDETVRLWDLVTGEEIQKLVGHSDWVNGVSFSPTGDKIISCSSDYTVRLWDVVSEM